MIGALGRYRQRKSDDFSTKSVPAPNNGQGLTEVLVAVPHLLNKVDSKSLLALQATCTSLHQALREPTLWQHYLVYRGQYILELPTSVPPPPPPLQQNQSFYQQCAIWYDLQHSKYLKQTRHASPFFLPKYQAWREVLKQYLPDLFWLSHEQEKRRQTQQYNWFMERFNDFMWASAYTTNTLIGARLLLYLGHYAISLVIDAIEQIDYRSHPTTLAQCIKQLLMTCLRLASFTYVVCFAWLAYLSAFLWIGNQVGWLDLQPINNWDPLE